MSYNQAHTQLTHSVKKPAKVLLSMFNRAGKAVEHQTANTSNPVSRSQLEVVRTLIGKGQYSKDIRIHARGKMGKMHHPSAHIKVEFRVVPKEWGFSVRPDGTRLKSDFEKIWDRLRRNRLTVCE